MCEHGEHGGCHGHRGHPEHHGHAAVCCCGPGLPFGRRFLPREERVAYLEEYLKELQAEAKAVEEHLAELQATG
jgi:hypothetical protein